VNCIKALSQKHLKKATKILIQDNLLPVRNSKRGPSKVIAMPPPRSRQLKCCVCNVMLYTPWKETIM